MRLTRQSEIAIGILVACARRPEQRVQTSVAANEAGATKMHAVKTVNLLVRAGYLTTSRGRHGGLGLARPAEAISLAAVLRCTQPHLTGTIDRTQRNGVASATLDTIVNTARSTFIALLERFTIADLVAKPAISRLACFDCKLINPPRRTSPDAPHRPRRESSQSYALHSHS